MSDSGWRKLGAATGIGFVALLVLSFILGATDPPSFNDGSGAAQSFVADNKNEIDTASALLAGALLLFAFFIGAVAGNNRRADRDGRLTATAHAGGIAALVLALGGVAVTAAASAAQSQTGDTAVVSALWNLGTLGFTAASLGVAILVYATGWIAVRFGALSSLLGYASIALGVATAAVAIIGLTTRDGAFSPYDGELPLILLGLFALWVIAVSANLWDRAGKR